MSGQLVYGSIDLSAAPYFVDFGSDFGAGPVDTATVSRLLTDGDIVSGARTGNATTTLVVEVASNSRAAFAAAETALFREADKATNTLTALFGAGDGLPVVADTFRAQLTPTYNNIADFSFYRSYTLTIPRLPFFRSPLPVSATPSASAAQVTSFDSLTGYTTTPTATVDTATFIEGTGSFRFPLTFTTGGPGSTASAQVVRTFSAVDYSSSTGWSVQWLTNVISLSSSTTLTLTSTGKSSTWTNTTAAPATSHWGLLTFDLTATPTATTGGGVALSAVTGYTITATLNTYQGAASVISPAYLWLDSLSADPTGAGTFVGGCGLLRFNVRGAARTAISAVVDWGATNTMSGVLLSNTPNAPPGYSPILTALGGTATLTWTRAAVSLRRAPPEPSTYRLMLFCNATLLAGTTVILTVTNSLTSGSTVVQRTLNATDPDMAAAIAISSASWALISMPAVTLPPMDVDPQNTAAPVTLTLTGGIGSGHIKEAFLVWTGAETVYTSGQSGITFAYLDAPAPTQQLGAFNISRSASGRLGAYAPTYRRGAAVVNFAPGDNSLLVVTLLDSSASTPAPTCTVSYYPRYPTERAS